jgi:hypothetical protein
MTKWEIKYYNLKGGSCLGCEKTKGAMEVQNARLAYVGNP